MHYGLLVRAIFLLLVAALLGLFMRPSKKAYVWLNKPYDKDLFINLRTHIQLTHEHGIWIVLFALAMAFSAGMSFELFLQ